MAERRLDDRDYLIVYVDGIQFGGHHVLAALGVDERGDKRVLGIREGASENAVVALGLLEGLVERGLRGLDPRRARLFVLDGSKALRAAVGQVFGSPKAGSSEAIRRAAAPAGLRPIHRPWCRGSWVDSTDHVP